jgi:DNA replication initiation complex subunit (GINS family)
MLTYETIRGFAKQEKESTKLVKLPEDFFAQAREYLEKKEAMGREKNNLWELQSARRVLEDLLESRERKIVTLALYSVRSGMMPENLAPEEREFFDSVKERIKQFRKKRRGVLEGGKAGRGLVVIKEDLPEFVGLDLKTYGPYSSGDIVTLPGESIKLLIEKKSAERIETG